MKHFFTAPIIYRRIQQYLSDVQPLKLPPIFSAAVFFWSQVSLQETKSMPEGSRERGVGLSGTLESVAAVERIIFEKLNARRATSLAPSPAEVSFRVSAGVVGVDVFVVVVGGGGAGVVVFPLLMFHSSILAPERLAGRLRMLSDGFLLFSVLLLKFYCQAHRTLPTPPPYRPLPLLDGDFRRSSRLLTRRHWRRGLSPTAWMTPRTMTR